MDKHASAAIVVPDAPAIPGLAFRGFGGAVDYAAMVDVINGSKQADDLVWTNTVEEIAYRKGFIDKKDLINLSRKYKNYTYGDYLISIAKE